MTSNGLVLNTCSTSGDDEQQSHLLAMPTPNNIAGCNLRSGIVYVSATKSATEWESLNNIKLQSSQPTKLLPHLNSLDTLQASTVKYCVCSDHGLFLISTL